MARPAVVAGLDIVAVDINTVSPPHDVNDMAAHLAAYLTFECLLLLEQQTRVDGANAGHPTS